MSRNFNFSLSGIRGPGARLRVLAIVLAVLNAAAIYFYIAPPGGSRRDLHHREAEIRSDIGLHQLATQRLKSVSQKVELGGEQTDQFACEYRARPASTNASAAIPKIRLRGPTI